MIGKITKLLIALSMIFTLAVTHSNGVKAAETNFESETGLFPMPSTIHEDADLLAELNNIGSQLKVREVESGIDVYRWLYDISYLNSKYSSAVSSTSVSREVSTALSNMPFTKKVQYEEDGVTKEKVVFNDQYYHDIGVVLKSLQKEIKGEKPFASMREAKDQTILSKIKRGTSLSDLRENDKMTTEDETYFNQYYQQGQEYKNGTIPTDEYKDWINSLKKLNNKYPNSSVNSFFARVLENAYTNGPSDYYDEIFGSLNSLWDQTHYDFAHVVSNTLDSIEIAQMPSVTTYTDGETFNPSGLLIDGTYTQSWSDQRTDTSYKVNNMSYTTDTTTKLTYFDGNGNHITSWPVTVNDGVTSKTINVPITVKAKLNSTEFTSIAVASQPKKTVYKEGDSFDSTGLSVTGTFTKSYSDNTQSTYTQPNMSFTVVDGSSLKAIQTSVKVRVTSNGTTKTIEVPVTVNKYVKSASVDSLVVTSAPNKVKYKAGQKIATKGLKVNAIIKKTMSDGSTEYETKKNVKVSVTYPYVVAQVGSNTITLTYDYNKNGFSDTKQTTITIEVTKKDTHLVNVNTPAKVKLKSVKPGKKKITVSWKKAKYAKKYKVYYRLKGQKKWKAKTVKKTKCVIKKLKSKKKYQVRVRAINFIVKGKYSKTKTVKVK